MRDIPTELLAEIFISCLPAFEEADIFIRDPSSAPLLLCQVSSRWRSIATSTPKLWAHIFISTKHFTSFLARSGNLDIGVSGANNEIQLFELWVSRRRALRPTSVSFRNPLQQLETADFDIHTELFNKLLSSTALLSCSTLTIDSIMPSHFQRLLRAIAEGSFHNLHSLSVIGCDSFECFASTSRGSCAIRRFHFESASDPSLAMKALRWETLTHLAIPYCNLDQDQWYWILQDCTSLTHLMVTLYIDPFTPNRSLTRPPVKREKLQEISIDSSFAQISLIFRGFLLPSVTKLRISCGSLACGEFITLPDLTQLLRATPNVRELHTQYCLPIGDLPRLSSFLGAAVELNEIPLTAAPLSHVAPNLQTLVFDGIGEGNAITPKDSLSPSFLQILQSLWLTFGWPSSRRSAIFLVDSSRIALQPEEIPQFEHDLQKELHDTRSFTPIVRVLPQKLWDWKDLGGYNLNFGWDNSFFWIE